MTTITPTPEFAAKRDLEQAAINYCRRLVLMRCRTACFTSRAAFDIGDQFLGFLAYEFALQCGMTYPLASDSETATHAKERADRINHIKANVIATLVQDGLITVSPAGAHITEAGLNYINERAPRITRCFRA